MTDINEILSWADLRSQLSRQRDLLTTKFKDDCTLAISGGFFDLTPELIAGIKLRREQTPGNELWILDRNGTPILIDNIDQWIEQATITYNSALVEFGAAHKRLIQTRSVSGILKL
jgi:hypothetical protein